MGRDTVARTRPAGHARRARGPAEITTQRMYRGCVIAFLPLCLACTGGKGSDTPHETADSDTPITGPLHLFYKGGPRGSVWNDDSVHSIYSASSADGITFSEDGLVFTSDAGNDPDAFPLGDGFALFTSTGPTLTFATATTINGPYGGSSEFSWFGGGGPSTIEVNGSTQVFYCGANGIDVATLITDPVSLSPFSSALVNPFGEGHICDPTVVRLSDGTYRMYYYWGPSLDSGPWLHAIYSATSDDGLHYTAVDTELRAQASVPGALVWGDTLYLYAVDTVGGGTPDSGDSADTAKPDVSGLVVGISTDGGATFEFQPVILNNAVMEEAFDPDAILVE